MISLNPEEIATQYGSVSLWQPVNYHYYSYDGDINDLNKYYRGRRWMVQI